MTRRRRQFSPEFKEEAVRMVLQGERTVASVAREITLMESPARHRRHKSSFIASDIPGRPIRATIHPSTLRLPIITSAQVMTLRGLRVAYASSGHPGDGSAYGRMIRCVPSLGLSDCHEYLRRAAVAAHERSGQGRGDPRPASPDRSPRTPTRRRHQSEIRARGPSPSRRAPDLTAA
ncbi:transposase [Nonomuraea sp. ZG12]|uniref:transposase n=1 Tax=Nonomuraea sp. ZG12 TaxID=3452207 RepID=UPI003F88BE01